MEISEIERDADLGKFRAVWTLLWPDGGDATGNYFGIDFYHGVGSTSSKQDKDVAVSRGCTVKEVRPL
jgi:hypothetical protein